MKTIIYSGPGHVLVAGDLRIRRGEPTEVSDQLFRQLQRDRSMTLTVVKSTRRRSANADSQAAAAANENAQQGEED